MNPNRHRKRARRREPRGHIPAVLEIKIRRVLAFFQGSVAPADEAVDVEYAKHAVFSMRGGRKDNGPQ